MCTVLPRVWAGGVSGVDRWGVYMRLRSTGSVGRRANWDQYLRPTTTMCKTERHLDEAGKKGGRAILFVLVYFHTC